MRRACTSCTGGDAGAVLDLHAGGAGGDHCGVARHPVAATTGVRGGVRRRGMGRSVLIEQCLGEFGLESAHSGDQRVHLIVCLERLADSVAGLHELVELLLVEICRIAEIRSESLDSATDIVQFHITQPHLLQKALLVSIELLQTHIVCTQLVVQRGHLGVALVDHHLKSRVDVVALLVLCLQRAGGDRRQCPAGDACVVKLIQENVLDERTALSNASAKVRGAGRGGSRCRALHGGGAELGSLLGGQLLQTLEAKLDFVGVNLTTQKHVLHSLLRRVGRRSVLLGTLLEVLQLCVNRTQLVRKALVSCI
mmetsp:Transcript_43899/g.76438  ORF Transcript_43899/g.76438 Transcript_43899/m.76438 type:complete len:310 (+) Transcript_43899:673-1602(+)